MKVIVVGLGSMGKRRIRLMRGFFPWCDICGVDSREDRRKEAEELFGIETCPDLAEAISTFHPEAAFVCTAPLAHSAIIRTLLQYAVSVFTEINLVTDGYDENTALAADRGLTLFLSSTPLYREEMRWIEGHVNSLDAPVWYRYHVGQYLPDWHPWENYQNFFVGDSRTGGVREILAIEFPWIESAFSEVEDFSAVSAKLTGLSIGYDDSLALILKHRNGTVGSLLIDVASRKAVRDLEIIGEQTYVRWSGSPDSLIHYDPSAGTEEHIRLYEEVQQDPRYASNIIENMYVDEMRAFFDVLAGKPARRHTFQNDKRILDLLDRIEEEAKH